MTYGDHREYWAQVAPRLHSYLEGLRDLQFEDGLTEALAYYSFVTEGFPAKVTRYSELLPKVTSLLLVTAEALRGVLPAYVNLSQVSLAALARVSLEAHITLKFIASSGNPATWSDRFLRFADVEKLLRAEHRLPEDGTLFPAGALDKVRSNSPEWITKKGKLRTFWTADDKLNSLGALAKEAGLREDYVRVYGATSKYVHGSALVANAFTTAKGLAPIGGPPQCRSLAGIVVDYCFKTLRVACVLFGVSHDVAAHLAVVVRVLTAASREDQPP